MNSYDLILGPVAFIFVCFAAHAMNLSPLSLWSLAVWLFLYIFLGPYRRYVWRGAKGSSCPWRDANRCEDTGGFDV